MATITKTLLETEIKTLEQQRDKFQASVNHFLGAIALCYRLISVIEKADQQTDDAGQVK